MAYDLQNYRTHLLMQRMRQPVIAAVSAAIDLPVADRALAWDGAEAASAVCDAATDKYGNVEPEAVAQAFVYQDDEAGPATMAAYKLGYADIIDGELAIVPRGLSAAAAAMAGSRGEAPEV